MRGGTANCTVIIADEEIGAPTVRNPRAALVFNLPSLDKYEPLVVPGGVLIANASLINRGFQRTDLDAVLIPANEIAEALGDKRLTNMVMLGALLAKLPVLPLEAMEKALEDHLPERHKKLLPLNFRRCRAAWISLEIRFPSQFYRCSLSVGKGNQFRKHDKSPKINFLPCKSCFR